MRTENNFVENLLKNGFKRHAPDYEKSKGRYDSFFNTQNGWMGLTVYHPYERFVKGDCVVGLSLEKFNTYMLVIENDKYERVNISEKEITVTIKGEKVYYNKNGVMPNEELQKIIYAD